jgi:hypothetical protein
MTRSPFAALLIGAISLIAPAVASAGTLTVSAPCFTHFPATSAMVKTQPIGLTITGGTPGGDFQVSAGATTPDGSSGSTTGTFDASGNATAALTDVFPPGGSINPLKGRTLVLSVHDFITETDIATATTQITNAAVEVASTPSNPYRKRLMTISGLTPLFGAGTLYGSYTSGYTGHTAIKTVKLGTPNACGYLAVHRVLPPRHGVHKWTLYVHVGKAFHRADSLVYKFQVFRRAF